MVLSTFSCSADDTRLIRHKDTLYKLKVVLATEVPQQWEGKFQASFHAQMEEVVRAVIFMVVNKRPLVKIQTRHCLVVPSLKIWRTGEKLRFRKSGKELEAFKYTIILHVTFREPRRKQRPVAVSAASKSKALPGRRGKEGTSADPTTNSARGESSGTKQGRLQQSSNKKSAPGETRDGSTDQHGQSSEQKSNSQLPASQITLRGPTAGSAAQPLIPETMADSSAAPSSQLERSDHQTSPRARSASSKEASSRPNITKTNKPHTPKDNLQESNSTQSGAAGDLRSSRRQKSTEGAGQASQRTKTSTLASQSGQQTRSSNTAGVEGSSDIPSSLHQTVIISSQPTNSPSSRQSVRTNSRTSLSNQDSQAGAVHSASHSGKVGTQPERANVRFAEKSREQASNRTDGVQDTLAKTSSPGSRKRYLPPLNFVHDTEITSGGRQNTEERSRVSSRQLSPRSRLRHQQNKQVPLAPSQLVLRSMAGRLDLGRPTRHTHSALSRGQPQTASRYDLRRTIQRSTMMEEQRLKGLASHSIRDDQHEGGPPSAPPAGRTFEQKDRYVVETGDLQEELKLQTLANAHHGEEQETRGSRGTKRLGGLVPRWTDDVVAPVKRALRAYKNV